MFENGEKYNTSSASFFLGASVLALGVSTIFLKPTNFFIPVTRTINLSGPTAETSIGSFDILPEAKWGALVYGMRFYLEVEYHVQTQSGSGYCEIAWTPYNSPTDFGSQTSITLEDPTQTSGYPYLLSSFVQYQKYNVTATWTFVSAGSVTITLTANDFLIIFTPYFWIIMGGVLFLGMSVFYHQKLKRVGAPGQLEASTLKTISKTQTKYSILFIIFEVGLNMFSSIGIIPYDFALLTLILPVAFYLFYRRTRRNIVRRDKARVTFTPEKVKTLEGLLQMSNRISITDIASLLDITRISLLQKLVEIAPVYKFKVQEDLIIFEEQPARDFITKLEQEFATWGKEGKR